MNLNPSTLGIFKGPLPFNFQLSTVFSIFQVALISCRLAELI